MELIQDSNLLMRYVMGTCSEDERKYMNQWIEESPSNAITFRHMRMMLNRVMVNN
jgi:anti-sigma factor RsiW